MHYTIHSDHATSRFVALYEQFKEYLSLIKPLVRARAPHWSNIEAEFYSQQQILDKCSLLSIADLKGNITYVNENFCRVSGYSPEEMIGQPHSIVRHPDTPAGVFKEMWQTIGSGKVWQGELKNRSKNGKPYWVFATISPVLDENGKPIRYISMRQDITRQKLIAEELLKMREICDLDLLENVQYGSQIHHTFLPSDQTIHDTFDDSFLIYKAQKIVSGDFYFAEKSGDKSIAIVGDSTGHGVAASYISIMILNCLKKIIRHTGMNPDRILSSLHTSILDNTCSSSGKKLMESADMAVCIIDRKMLTLEYSMAKMRGVIIRNAEVIELERERCSIGDQNLGELKIRKAYLDLLPGDQLYLYTDGMIDQFGGPSGKKFTNRQLLSFLQAHSHLRMEDQKRKLEETMNAWQGDGEQTDDMTFLGIRIS